MKLLYFLFLFFLLQCSFAESLPINELKLPSGFKIEIFAYPIDSARSLALGEQGTVFVGTNGDKVYAIVREPKNHSQIFTIASGLNAPNGVAFYQHDLYVSEINRILKFPNIEANLKKPPNPIVIYSALPNDSHHGWRYIAFGPDKKLYIAIGMPCNVCRQNNPVFGTICRLNPDGSHFEIYAKGIRNSVGFDWQPGTKNLWFTDNGRDWLGDLAPPDELNEVTAAGQHFGFPYLNGKTPDPGYGRYIDNVAKFTPPKIELTPHVAALGMKFYRGNQFPLPYQQQILIAEHGSWNRSNKVGYQVVAVDVNNNRVHSFITGWLKGEKAWGRPVDILQLPDGSILISDDHAGAIYRVTYHSNI